MAAYLIVYARITDATQFAVYAEAVQPLIRQHGGRAIGRGRPPVVLEGHWGFTTAGVLEFPSMDAIQTFWASPEYEKVKALRVGAAEFQVLALPEAPAPA